jgi:beta-glucanase (GH16 family)
METIPFTHALLDYEGLVIKKFRWTNNEYKWYIKDHPGDTIIKLKQPVYKSDYHSALELVGECLF